MAIFALLFIMFTQNSQAETETVVVGAGCFWCIEGVYKNLEGVQSAVSGFAGGSVPNPTYEQVCTGKTGHAEVVKITFDPTQTSLEKIVRLFWQIHDPTDARGVWPDFGPMYRSILLGSNPSQTQKLQELKTLAQKDFPLPIVTEIAPLTTFYPAEDYHQDFVANNPRYPYVQQVAAPKIEKAKAILKKENPSKP